MGNVSRDSLQQLPSSVYWTGLGKWGIRKISYPRDIYHKRIDEIYQSRESLEKNSAELNSSDDKYESTNRFENMAP